MPRLLNCLGKWIDLDEHFCGPDLRAGQREASCQVRGDPVGGRILAEEVRSSAVVGCLHKKQSRELRILCLVPFKFHAAFGQSVKAEKPCSFCSAFIPPVTRGVCTERNQHVSSCILHIPPLQPVLIRQPASWASISPQSSICLSLGLFILVGCWKKLGGRRQLQKKQSNIKKT